MLNFIFRNNCDNACSVILFSTNQTQRRFDSKKNKIELRFGMFLDNTGPKKNVSWCCMYVRVQQTLCKEAKTNELPCSTNSSTKTNVRIMYVRTQPQTLQQKPTWASCMCARREIKISSPRVGAGPKSHIDDIISVLLLWPT